MANPSMDDLLNGTGTGVAPNPKTPELTEEQKKQEAEQKAQADAAAAAQKITDLRAKDPATLTVDEKALVDADDQKQQQARDQRMANLKAKPADQLTEEEKKELADAAVNESDDAEEGNFWDDVDKLRGEKIEIDWTQHTNPDGTQVDPESPAGALIRENYIAQQAIQGFEQHLMDSDPRAYAYILHRQAGGTDEDFFGKKTLTLPEYDKFKESVDLQQKVYRDDLLRKGLSADDAKYLVDKAVADKKIFDLADSAYKAYDAAQKKELDDAQRLLQKQQDEFKLQVSSLDKMLTEEITSNTSMNFIVPDAKKQGFAAYVRGLIRADEGKFYVAQEINQKSLGRVLEALYLQFVNGDLGGLVKRTAKTENTRRLKRSIDNSRKMPAASETQSTGKKTVTDLF